MQEASKELNINTRFLLELVLRHQPSFSLVQGGTQAKGKEDEDGAGPIGKVKKQKAGAAGKKSAKKAGAKTVRKKPGKAAAGGKGRKKK